MTTQTIQYQYEAYKAQGLTLNMQRGQPSDADFDLSLPMLTVVDAEDVITPSGIDIRNYPGGVAGLPEARALFSEMLRVAPSEILLGNSSSLEMMASLLKWIMLRGVSADSQPWVTQSPKMIITVPGYDRHFSLLQTIGFELVAVPINENGPDMDAVEALVANDASIKGIFFVPTYSNPTGDTISEETAQRLVSMPTAASDFVVFADDAYAVHHLDEDRLNGINDIPNLLEAAKAAGNPERVILFGSTSKVTFSGAGLGYMGMSETNLAYWSKLLGQQTIGPNKVEQWRHVRFLEKYPGGWRGLMSNHAKIIKPKFDAVMRVLEEELGGTGLARWTKPRGGYFISLDTTHPIAKRVIELAGEAGVSLTPAGSTYPNKVDPNNTNIRLAPTRPPLEEVEQAMQVVATCIKLASAEYDG
ncbi:MAG: aminotransferase class I/II-fold pyridoxal phosphate-dependent enzyme [Chloroflexota bacterium]